MLEMDKLQVKIFIVGASMESLVTERLNKNLGRDVKAGSDLVLEFLLSIWGPLFSFAQPFSIPLSLGCLKEEFSGRNHKPSILEEQPHPATAAIGCRGEPFGGLLSSQE